MNPISQIKSPIITKKIFLCFHRYSQGDRHSLPIHEAMSRPAATPYSGDGNYSAVSGVPVPVTVTAASSSGSHSSSISTLSLPSELTDAPTNTTVVLSDAAFPAWVTGVSLSVAPEGSSASAPGTAGVPADPQGAAVYHLVINRTGL